MNTEFANLSSKELARMKSDREEEDAAKKLETTRIEAAKALASKEQKDAGGSFNANVIKPVEPPVRWTAKTRR